MYLLYDYFAVLVVIALGLIVLVRRNQLNSGEVFAALFLASYAGVLGFLLYLGTRSAHRFGDALASLGNIGNRILRPFVKRDRFDVSHAHEFARDIAEGLEAARRTPGGLILPAALALSNRALMIATLFLIFLAFAQPFSVGTLIAGYSIGALFAVVSPTPSGLGFVEGAMTLVLTTLHVPLASAAVITLAYRGVTFWFPLLLGFVALRWTERVSHRPGPD
ncbi:MAG: lysylphosphatidylglycerol synthase transmembrane domain-containing protein [Anaerolineales bacterium]